MGIKQIVGCAALAISLGGGAATAADSPAKDTNRPCTDMSRKCIIEVAQTYLHARTDNSAKPTQRLAPNIHRWENGRLTAESAADILAQNYIADPGPSSIFFPRDLDRVLVDGNQAVFFWKIDAKKSSDGPFTSTVLIFERFKVEPGKAKCGSGLSPCITEIEALVCTVERPQDPTMPPPPRVLPAGGGGCNSPRPPT